MIHRTSPLIMHLRRVMVQICDSYEVVSQLHCVDEYLTICSISFYLPDSVRTAAQYTDENRRADMRFGRVWQGSYILPARWLRYIFEQKKDGAKLRKT